MGKYWLTWFLACSQAKNRPGITLAVTQVDTRILGYRS
jgi:hypothetical protein